MDTREFLEAVWPASGVYCFATPYEKTYRHKTFDSIDAFIRYVQKNPEQNSFFAVHTLKQHRVWNPMKRFYDPDKVREDPDGNQVTGEWGAYEVRTHSNMLESRCFFFDLDVGESTSTVPKFATQREALEGLEAFLFHTRLPTPLITSSGGGYHVYWPLDAAIPSSDWRGWAAKLYHLARREGLRVDPSRTTDQSSVLRVVGTKNVKPGRDPRECEVLQVGAGPTPNETFLAQLTALVGSDAVVIPSDRKPKPRAHGNLAKVWQGGTRTIDEVAEVCEHVRTYRGEGYTEGGYVRFYNLGCGVIPFLEGGESLAMEYALKHPRCTEEYVETNIEKWRAGSDGPSSCKNLDIKCGGDACARCPFSKLGANPLIIATKKLEQAALPPPVLVDAEAAPRVFIDPPEPYKRTKAGLKETIFKKQGDTDVAEDVLVCPYDMYPDDVLDKTELENAFSLWVFEIPHKGKIKVKITSTLMADTKSFHSLMLNEGVHIQPAQAERLKKMLPLWLKKVQDTIESNRQFDHLGWVDKTTTEFIMPTQLLNIDGTYKACELSALSKQSMHFVRSAGTLEGSIKAFSFYNRPEYIKHQFMILMALGAPLFHATGHAGVVVNASGDSGGSKSTSLYGGASLWGDPELYTINGTNKGATLLSQMRKIFTFSNLPVCIDEITKMSNENVADFVFNATQRNEREGLKSDGTPRPVRIQWKSTPLLCSANTSLHHILSLDSLSGVAGNMRVFEIFFPKLDEEHKPEASEFMRQINLHYGHIGPAFLNIYIKQRAQIDAALQDLMDKLDTRFKLTAPERYWSGCIATALITCALARQAGLLPYEVEPIREWLLGPQLAEMRSMITTEETDHGAMALLVQFLNDKMSQTILVDPPDKDGKSYALRAPVGSIVAHQDNVARVIHIRRDSFRTWCEGRKQHGLQKIAELQRAGAIFDTNRKRVLGKGTQFATGQVNCFSVDQDNKEFAGAQAAAGPKVVQLRRTGQ